MIFVVVNCIGEYIRERVFKHVYKFSWNKLKVTSNERKKRSVNCQANASS
jgi:hypothetical protein